MGAQRSPNGALGMDRNPDGDGFNALDFQRIRDGLVSEAGQPGSFGFCECSEDHFERNLHHAGISGRENLPG